MKSFFCFLICLLLTYSSYAQENEKLTKRLEEKYGYACYHESDGISWYTIRRGDWRTKGNEGACDSEGRETIPPIWDDVMFRKSYYEVEKNNKVGIRDINNKELLPCSRYTAVRWYQKKDYGGYCEVEIDGKKGVIDKDNKEVISCLYDNTSLYSLKECNYCVVELYGKKGVVNKSDQIVISFQYDDINVYSLKEGTTCEVKLNGKVGVYDIAKRQEVLPCKYTAVRWYQKKDYGGYCKVEIDGKIGVIDKDNKEVIPCLYEDVYVHQLKEQPFCTVKLNGKQGVADINGNEIVHCKYDEVSDWQFKDGEFCEVKSLGRIGIVNKKREEVIPCGQYSYIRFSSKSPFAIVSNDVDYERDKNRNAKIAKINKSGKWGVFDLTAKKEIIPCKYDFVRPEEDGIFAFNVGGKNIIEKEHGTSFGVDGGKWGYVDTTGKEVVTAQYDNVTGFTDGVAQVMKSGIVSMLSHPLKGSSVKMANGGNIIAVDHNIPTMNRNNENTFAFIIANENYTHFTGADYSINDGKIFAEYCKKTLGIPESNVRYYEDATYGNIVNAVKKLRDIADVYEGDARIILYYSGLGATDEKSMEKFLLASDASLAALNSTGYSVPELLKVLNSLNVVRSWVILDAPFSNVDKKGDALTEARGVALKAKAIVPNGNVIISQACDDMQAAYSSKQLGHGLFTYGLLEKLQQTKGECTIKEMNEYATNWVKKYAMSKFDKMQTPIINVSKKLDYMDNIKLY